MKTRVISYRPRMWTLVWSGAFFVVCTAVIGHEAIQAGSVVLWLVTAASAAFVVAAVFLGVMRVLSPQRVVLEEGAITVPKGRWSQGERRIELHEIEWWEYKEIHGQKILEFWVAGEKFSFVASMFERDDVFWEAAAHLGCPRQAVEAELEESGPTPPHRRVGGMTYILGVKVTGIFSFCGGPLFWSDYLKPILGQDVAFGVTFAPVALLIYGSLFFADEPDAMARWSIRLGALGGVVIVLANCAALFLMWQGTEHPNAVMIGLGSLAGFGTTGLYLWLAHHFFKTAADPLGYE